MQSDAIEAARALLPAWVGWVPVLLDPLTTLQHRLTGEAKAEKKN